jgi:hypothetical protein
MSNMASLRLGCGEEHVLTLRATVHLATTFVALTSSGSRCVVGVAATATPSKTFASIAYITTANNTFSIVNIATNNERFSTTVVVPSNNFTIATTLVSTGFTRAIDPLHRVIRCM